MTSSTRSTPDAQRRRLSLALAAAVPAGLLGTAPARAAFPDKPIRILVPYSAGGGTDAIARHLAERLRPRLNQPVLVENRPGADGVIGTDMVAKSPPDGSSLVMVVASHLINPLVMAKMPYDTQKDLIGVTMVAYAPLAFLVGANVPANSMAELTELIRKTPKRYSYGSSESMTRLVGAMYIEGQKLDAVHVPYKGSAPLITDIAAGNATLGVSSVVSAKQLVVGGKLKALAVTGPKRTAILPDVPTMTEAGLPGFDEVRTTFSLFAPAGTPTAVLERLQGEISGVLQTPDMKDVLASQAAVPVGNTVTDFNKQVQRETQFWTSLAKSINLRAE